MDRAAQSAAIIAPWLLNVRLSEMPMLKKALVMLAVLVATIGSAFAQVDVNKADQASLDGVRGIGPATSKKILDERKQNGNFRDWDDFETRVSGIGPKSAAKLSQAGLTVNGRALANAPAGKAGAASPANNGREVEPNSRKASVQQITGSVPVLTSSSVAPPKK